MRHPTLALLAAGAVLLAGLAAASPALADRPTARSSGVQAVHLFPRSGSAVIDKLRNNERVYLDRCTRKARWCLVRQLDGGPSGWVPGSWLIGSPAKVQVTPFEFSFDPLDPIPNNFPKIWN
ncbi:MAG: SH3 domain-containing protein [Hyphomicrobiales bacterium]|nr:MAG: SH3 domain-containing protein [Hyphomicrobiales bacterium]